MKRTFLKNNNAFCFSDTELQACPALKWSGYMHATGTTTAQQKLPVEYNVWLLPQQPCATFQAHCTRRKAVCMQAGEQL